MTTAQQKPANIQHLALPIRDLGCAGAAQTIERVLREVPGVTRVYVNPVTEMAYVEYETDRCGESTLRVALNRAGYKTAEPRRYL